MNYKKYSEFGNFYNKWGFDEEGQSKNKVWTVIEMEPYPHLDRILLKNFNSTSNCNNIRIVNEQTGFFVT